jgi:hypothetical protein
MPTSAVAFGKFCRVGQWSEAEPDPPEWLGMVLREGRWVAASTPLTHPTRRPVGRGEYAFDPPYEKAGGLRHSGDRCLRSINTQI